MKKIFTKIKNLMLHHKLLSIICLLAFILFIILIFMVISMTISTSNKYGNRLDGIKEVEISKKALTKMSDKVKETEEVKDANVHLKGKIIYFDINFVKGTSQEKAKEIASATVSELSEKELSFYDLEYVLTEDNDGDKEASTFVITGTKHSKKENITWIKS